MSFVTVLFEYLTMNADKCVMQTDAIGPKPFPRVDDTLGKLSSVCITHLLCEFNRLKYSNLVAPSASAQQG